VGNPDKTCLEGRGYILVGVEPGAVPGVIVPDPAQVEDALDSYLGGASGPPWRPAVVPFENVDVLVIVVEPSHPGSPLYLLRKTIAKFPDGTVFVRRGTRVMRASAAEMDLLHERMAPVRQVGDARLSQFADLLILDIEPQLTELVLHHCRRPTPASRCDRCDTWHALQRDLQRANRLSMRVQDAGIRSSFNLFRAAARNVPRTSTKAEDGRTLARAAQDRLATAIELVETAIADLAESG